MTRRNIVFVTYNSIPRATPGWRHSEQWSALTLQGQLNKKRRNRPLSAGIISFYNAAMERDATVKALAKDLREAIQRTRFHYCVLYLGHLFGCETQFFCSLFRANRNIAFDPNRLVLVSCGCEYSLAEKRVLVRVWELQNATRILCECGGEKTLGEMYERWIYSFGKGKYFIPPDAQAW